MVEFGTEERISYRRGDFYWITIFEQFNNSISARMKVEEGDSRYYHKWKASLISVYDTLSSFFNEDMRKKLEKEQIIPIKKYINQNDFKKAYPHLVYMQRKISTLITQASIPRKTRMRGLSILKKEILG